MFHKFDVVMNSSTGVPMSGILVRCYNITDGSLAALYADASGTPIESVSGVANSALSDGEGNYSFWIADGTYNIEFYRGTALVSVVPSIAMYAYVAATDLSGDDGATKVGTPSGTVQVALDARPLSVTLADSTGAELIGSPEGTVQDALDARIKTTDAASPTGSSLIGFLPSGTGAVSRTGQDKLRDFLTVQDFGAKGDGATNDTAAFLAAFASGRKIYAPTATYIVDTLDIPGVMGFEFIGDGPNRTILQASAPNQPILRKEQVAGVVQHGEIGHFSLKAHADGSTGTAFDQSGFRNVKFSHIMGLSNGTKGFQSLFDVAAAPYMTYGCTWSHCGLAEQAGWDNVWLFNNRGAGVGGNANACRILDAWIYANTGLTYGIDAGRSAMLSILGGLVEGNASGTAMRVGQATFVQGVWLESNNADVEYAVLADGVANDGMLLNNYFSGAHAVDMTGVSRNLWIGNREPVGSLWTGNNGTNIRVKPTAAGVSAPTLAYTSGTSGTLTALGATRTADPDLVNKCVYEVPYTWAASLASGQTNFTITPPSGWTIASVSASASHDGTHEPAKVALVSPTSIWLTNTFTNNHTIMLFITLVAA